MVIPPVSKDILPKEYQKEMKDTEPFNLDVTAGKKFAYSEPILSEIDYKKTIKNLKKIKLTKTNMNRNKVVYEPFVF